MNVYSGLFSHSRGYFSMRKHFLSLFIISLFVIFVFSACDANLRQEPTGKATISVENKIENSSFTSESKKSSSNIIIAEYIITGKGPNGAKIYETVDAKNATASFDSMTVGDWNIKAKAIDINNVTVGEGNASTKIDEGKENPITIDVKEKEGKGKLVVSINCTRTSPNSKMNIKVTSEKDNNATTEELIEDNAGSNTYYYSTVLDLDNGFYKIDVIENETVKYSDQFRIVNNTITYFYGDLDDTGTAKIKSTLARNPEIMFLFKQDTVALNGILNQSASVFHLDLSPQTNIYYQWSYKGNILGYSKSFPLSWNLEESKTVPDKGKNVLTFSVKIGNINGGKTIGSKDFYFEVTDAVTETSLADAINALPDKYDYGMLSSYESHNYNTCKLNNTEVLLSDNTTATFNTKDGEAIELTRHKIHQEDYNLIKGNVEITHNNKTSYYVIDKNSHSYIHFDINNSNGRLYPTKIEGENILKDGVDISNNNQELKKLASYFVALILDDKKTGVTYDSSKNSTISYYEFKNYKSGNYSIDGTVEFHKNSDNVAQNPYTASLGTSLTFRKDNSKNVLSFTVNYKKTGKQYSDIEITNIILDGKEFTKEQLAQESIDKIERFAGCSNK